MQATLDCREMHRSIAFVILKQEASFREAGDRNLIKVFVKCGDVDDRAAGITLDVQIFFGQHSNGTWRREPKWAARCSGVPPMSSRRVRLYSFSSRAAPGPDNRWWRLGEGPSSRVLRAGSDFWHRGWRWEHILTAGFGGPMEAGGI